MSWTEHRSDDDGDLVIKATGPVTEGGRLPLSELARLAGGLQASLERIALSISGNTTRPGRRPREIVDAVRLDFVGFHEGSAVLHVARTGQLALDDLLGSSLDALEAGVNSLQRDPLTLPPHFTPQVVNGIRDLTGGISASNVTRIEFRRSGTVRFTIDETLQQAVRSIQTESVQQAVTVVGRLHMGDFSPAGLRCRIDTYAGSVLCDFTRNLRDSVLDAMDQMVMAEGTGEFDPNGTSVHVLHLARLEVLDSARPRSLDSLAREQGIRPLTSADELSGPPIEDFDEFLTAIRSARTDDE
ncbi:hypothetical protein GCM10010112_38770 [Actinoplanes lobatus]|uniref:Uncharacterized protein n=1 Tax=Actinoplanes lobatus TaxID=113568 RepID=A0A7W7MHH2_9ACTN|nr:hypothetical protein [Actinoplanes lobatus]MBB4750331.1 hypothetical protein [Actinoplanes lobatus]GGN71420.1 hypothetical protein GCM10010112_38770 [Actinoplanes lobatus]GIE41875.1 hypothetical protein Alo02nite_47730 [Actinoplanes lobatus]